MTGFWFYEKAGEAPPRPYIGEDPLTLGKLNGAGRRFHVAPPLAINTLKMVR